MVDGAIPGDRIVTGWQKQLGKTLMKVAVVRMMKMMMMKILKIKKNKKTTHVIFYFSFYAPPLLSFKSEFVRVS